MCLILVARIMLLNSSKIDLHVKVACSIIHNVDLFFDVKTVYGVVYWFIK